MQRIENLFYPQRNGSVEKINRLKSPFVIIIITIIIIIIIIIMMMMMMMIIIIIIIIIIIPRSHFISRLSMNVRVNVVVNRTVVVDSD